MQPINTEINCTPRHDPDPFGVKETTFQGFIQSKKIIHIGKLEI